MSFFAKFSVAWRNARGLAGGFTGFIFMLSAIFDTPVKGKSPSILVAAVSVFALILELKESHNSPVAPALRDYKENTIRTTTQSIAAALVDKPEKLATFLATTEQKLQVPPQFSTKQLEEMLNQAINNNLDHAKWEKTLREYINATAALLIQIGSHFSECMLAKAYDRPDLFRFKNLGADNIFAVLLLILAVYNGVESFQSNYNDSRKVSIDTVCAEFNRTYC